MTTASNEMALVKRAKNVAIIGATGAVGEEMMKVLERRNFPVNRLRLFASPRSVGKTRSFLGENLVVEQIYTDSFEGVDIALFSAGATVSQQYARMAADSGCVVIDNSSAFRMDSSVPLVIPEINPQDATWNSGIIANPNCTTAITLMALYPLHKAFGCKRIIASSYQAVSGAGAKGTEELWGQIKDLVCGGATKPKVFPYQIALNVIPRIDRVLSGGYTKEEMKMAEEGRKIMHHQSFRASVTCVRVPVMRAHSVSVAAEFEVPVSAAAAREVLRRAVGVEVIDDPARDEYPTPLFVSEKDLCQVGRIREDCALDNGLSFWVCGDQLLKGAALNAVQIAELL